MMRQKSYYTVDEIIANLYTSGQELMTEQGVEYQGQYHRYITGETYSMNNWDAKLSKKLIPYEDITSTIYKYKQLKNISNKYNSIVAKQPTISDIDRKAGYIMRYFIQRTNNLQIVEIDAIQYQMWQNKKIDPNLYNAIELIWVISGNFSANQTRTIEANKTMPGLLLKLPNPTEYSIDTDFTVPKDINE
jgi:hypothetical protein